MFGRSRQTWRKTARLGFDFHLSSGIATTEIDNEARCVWCVGDSEYTRYHDEEWARPLTSENLVYEKICLEGFQAGLSWLTILRKRPKFREVFANFDPLKVAQFDSHDVDRLMQEPGIVRHRGKIESAIANATATLRVQQEFGSLTKLIWSFCPERYIDQLTVTCETRVTRETRETNKTSSSRVTRSSPKFVGDIPSVSPESMAMSKKLRALGFKFVGPTTMYAAMQSMGLVNDHFVGCFVREECDRLRQKTLEMMLA